MNAFFLALALLAADSAEVWPAFRGSGDSKTSARDLPLKWSDDENIAWKADLPGYGQSSPVIWKGRIFVTSVEGAEKERLHLVCADLESGKPLWTKEFPASHRTKDSGYVSKGAPTPAVDAKRIYAFWESGDLIAASHDGKVAWKRELTKEYGVFEGNHGLGSSLAATSKYVFVLVDHGGSSYLLAVEKATGKNAWKTPRKNGTSWSSPIVTRQGDRTLVVVSSSGSVDAYDAASGKQVWVMTAIEGNSVPAPTVSDGRVFVGSRLAGNNLAVRLGGAGDVTESHVAWRAAGITSSFASPLAHRGMVYFVNRAGVASCLDQASGKKQWSTRLPGSCWVSPVGAGDRVYFFAKDGGSMVVRVGSKLEKLAENSLKVTGRVYGVAAVDGAFVLRTGRRLIRLGRSAKRL